MIQVLQMTPSPLQGFTNLAAKGQLNTSRRIVLRTLFYPYDDRNMNDKDICYRICVNE